MKTSKAVVVLNSLFDSNRAVAVPAAVECEAVTTSNAVMEVMNI